MPARSEFMLRRKPTAKALAALNEMAAEREPAATTSGADRRRDHLWFHTALPIGIRTGRETPTADLVQLGPKAA